MAGQFGEGGGVRHICKAHRHVNGRCGASGRGQLTQEAVREDGAVSNFDAETGRRNGMEQAQGCPGPPVN